MSSRSRRSSSVAAQGVVLQGEGQHVGDGFYERLVLAREGILLARREPDGPVDACPSAHCGDETRRASASMTGWAPALESAMRCPMTSNSPSARTT